MNASLKINSRDRLATQAKFKGRLFDLKVFTPVIIASVSLLLVSCGSNDNVNTDWSGWDGSCNDNVAGDLPTDMTWQWQLTDAIDTSVNASMYDVDMFNVTQAEMEKLHADGRTVICYFSAGTWEDWRDDKGDFPAEILGNTMEDWKDERWLDIRSSVVRKLMRTRLDMAVDKKCDGVEPDNMDGYLNKPGFDFDGFDQLDYNQFIAEEAHLRGLSVGLKNDVDQIRELLPCFDWALNEECFAYNECGNYAPFVQAGKAVFHVEYVDKIADGAALANKVCGNPSVKGLSTLIKDWNLSAWRIDCD